MSAMTGSLSTEVVHDEFKWHTDFDLFNQTEGPRVLLFTAENWCSWCKKLDKRILDKPEFADAISKKITFFKVDLENGGDPRMLEVFKAQRFPTMVFIDSKGNKIGEMGFKNVSPEKYAELIHEIFKKAGERV